jgi:HK97 family phage prohead protease
MIKLTAQVVSVDAAAGDQPSRQISGIAVPYGETAIVSDGTAVRFLQGALPTEGKAPKLFMYHQSDQPVGLVTAREDTDAGMLFTARISATAAGDEALTLALDGVLDSVSVGVNPTKFTYDDEGTMIVQAADWLELSLVPIPAFAGAEIQEVYASAENTVLASQEEPDTDPTPEPVEEIEQVDTKPTPEVVEASTPTVLFAQPKAAFKMPSLGEYMSKILAGGVEAQQFLANLKAAAPDVTTSDTPGILPEPIIGSVYNNFLPNYRPLVTAMGTKAMPQGGKIFRRPSVTTHTTIGLSNGENVPLDDGTFVVSDNPVTKQVFGGFVQLSEEDQEWTEPAVLSLLVDDMARIYAQQTDVYACQEFEAGVTQTATLTSAIDPADWIAFVYEAAQTILLNSNGNLPNVLIMDPLYFRTLGALSDQDGRPLFPTIGPMNASGSLAPTEFGGTAFGLQIVVDKNLVKAGGNNLYVGRSDGFECFEQPKGAISVEAADGSLSRFIKFRGYFATLMIDDTKFVTRA